MGHVFSWCLVCSYRVPWVLVSSLPVGTRSANFRLGLLHVTVRDVTLVYFYHGSTSTLDTTLHYHCHQVAAHLPFWNEDHWTVNAEVSCLGWKPCRSPCQLYCMDGLCSSSDMTAPPTPLRSLVRTPTYLMEQISSFELDLFAREIPGYPALSRTRALSNLRGSRQPRVLICCHSSQYRCVLHCLFLCLTRCLNSLDGL